MSNTGLNSCVHFKVKENNFSKKIVSAILLLKQPVLNFVQDVLSPTGLVLVSVEGQQCHSVCFLI